MFEWIKKLWARPESKAEDAPVKEQPINEPELKYLIAGLGNIGAEYDDTRHNIGFEIVDTIAYRKELTFETGKNVTMTNFRFKGKSITMIKPTTYMNLSGKAVRYWLQELKIPQENLLVLVDDLDLPFGKLRLKKKGSAGGHNGLKDIEAKLGNNNYCRLRFGIGDTFKRGRQVDYVLGKWDKREQEDLMDHINEAIKFVFDFVAIGPDRAMNVNNKNKQKKKKEE